MTSPYIITASGKKFFFNDIRPEQFDITDIAHALANTGRFNGHTKTFYSVAQHSCIVHDLLKGPSQWLGLLHDGSEAYTGDMVSPLKSLLPSFQAYEDAIQHAIYKFLTPVSGRSLTKQMIEDLHWADKTAFQAEVRDLHAGTDFWTDFITPQADAVSTINPWKPSYAQGQFMRRYNALVSGVEKRAA